MTKLQLLAGVGVAVLVLTLVWYDLRTKLDTLCDSMKTLALAMQETAKMWLEIAESTEKEEREEEA